MDTVSAIPIVRESIVAVLRYRMIRPQTIKKGKTKPAQFNLSWGSGFCIVSNRYIITAYHVLNGGQPRNVTDKFIVFVVPGNGDVAHHFPVIGFPLEKPDLDLAILEIGPCTTAGIQLSAIPV
jgi:S1-C subfamily serine protease